VKNRTPPNQEEPVRSKPPGKVKSRAKNHTPPNRGTQVKIKLHGKVKSREKGSSPPNQETPIKSKLHGRQKSREKTSTPQNQEKLVKTKPPGKPKNPAVNQALAKSQARNSTQEHLKSARNPSRAYKNSPEGELSFCEEKHDAGAVHTPRISECER
jgi:hypothetical protein